MNLEDLVPRKSSFLPFGLMKNFYESVSNKEYPSGKNRVLDNPLEFGNSNPNIIASEMVEYVRDIPSGSFLFFNPPLALAYYAFMTYFADRISEWIS